MSTEEKPNPKPAVVDPNRELSEEASDGPAQSPSPSPQTEKPAIKSTGTSKSKKSGGAQAEEPKSLWARLEAKLPAWCLKIKDRRQQKIFFRCWVASWLAVMLILPNGNLRIMGNAAFFAGIASVMMPANMPIQTFLMAMIILILGCCLGWAWGCAAMAAAYRARDKELYQRTLQQLAGQYGSNFSSSVVQLRIFHGDFLDTRSTVVFGVFLGVASFVLGYVRTLNPKLTLPSIFATIFVDVICSFGPLIPTPQYTILNTFVISTSYYIAIGIFCIMFIFPQTLNHQWLSDANTILTSLKELVEGQDKVLQLESDEMNRDEGSLYSKLRAKAEGLVASFEALSAKTPMLKMEFTYGQLGAEDLEDLEPSLKLLLLRTRGLQSFFTLLIQHVESRGKDKTPASPGTPAEPLDSKLTPLRSRKVAIGDTFRLMQFRDVDSHWEDEHQLHIEELLPILESATANLRKATLNGIKTAISALTFINTQRWKRHLIGGRRVLEQMKEEERDVGNALAVLEDALREYTEEARMTLLEPYQHFLASPFEVDQHGRPPFSLRPLFVCFVFQCNLIWTAEALQNLLKILNAAQKKRTKAQIWFPKGLDRIFQSFFGDVTPLDEDIPPVLPFLGEKVEDDAFENKYRKDPDALPPANIFQKFGDIIHRIHHWLVKPRTIYAFKVLVVTIALWLPQVFKSSAWFTYRERGLWGLIMGQLTLTVYMSDQLSAVVGRFVGTLAGGFLGAAWWYVGNARGQGNPFGTAASTALFLLPIVFYRLFGPSIMEGIMTGSLRLDVRRSNASTIRAIARLYSMLLSTWLSDTDTPVNEEDSTDDTSTSSSDRSTDDDGTDKPLPYAKWRPVFHHRMIEVATRVQQLSNQTKTAKWEGSIRGKWPHKKYERLVEIESTMLNNLAQLSTSLVKLEPRWRKALLHRTAFLNPNLITDVMAVFGIVSMSLDTGEAIHEVLPKSLLDRVFYHHSLAPHNQQNFEISSEDASTVGEVHQHPLNIDTFGQAEFAVYATGCAAAYQILAALDEIHRIAKDLCGEIPLQGFEAWRKEFELRQLGERV
ncbi:hypothetical protein FRB90_011004 [Tulasnella sp. 427]|nr:hypothetical protein FRB90_011004 [Tulasnella sp. 427]